MEERGRSRSAPLTRPRLGAVAEPTSSPTQHTPSRSSWRRRLSVSSARAEEEAPGAPRAPRFQGLRARQSLADPGQGGETRRQIAFTRMNSEMNEDQENDSESDENQSDGSEMQPSVVMATPLVAVDLSALRARQSLADPGQRDETRRQIASMRMNSEMDGHRGRGLARLRLLVGLHGSELAPGLRVADEIHVMRNNNEGWGQSASPATANFSGPLPGPGSEFFLENRGTFLIPGMHHNENCHKTLPPVEKLINTSDTRKAICQIIDLLDGVKQPNWPSPPAEFFCPVSLFAMHDPAVAADGQTYEKAWAERHILTNGVTSPKSRQPMHDAQLYSSAAVRSIMETWAKMAADLVLGKENGDRAKLVDRLRTAIELIEMVKEEKHFKVDKETQCP